MASHAIITLSHVDRMSKRQIKTVADWLNARATMLRQAHLGMRKVSRNRIDLTAGGRKAGATIRFNNPALWDRRGVGYIESWVRKQAKFLRDYNKAFAGRNILRYCA